jgi:hypothetical protein
MNFLHLNTKLQSMTKLSLSPKRALGAFVMALALAACGGGNSNQANNAPTMDEGAHELTNKDEFFKDREQALKQIFFSIPAPIEMADMMKDAGYVYDKSLLNPVEKATKYLDEETRSINLGIYAADLSYATVFDQKQESVDYLAATKTLAAALAIDGAIDEKFVQRVQANQNNKDSLMFYVTYAYQNINAYLKEGKRTDVSALMISGAWVESLYLSCHYAMKKGDKQMKQRVAEQVYSIDHLVSYMNLFGTSERVNRMKADLATLQNLFKEVKITPGETSVSTSSAGVTNIGSSTKVEMSEATLNKIASEAKSIRNKYIQ